MSRTTPTLRTAAERLLELESSAKRGAAKLPAVARVSGRLGEVLGMMLGTVGYRALLSRAVTLAKLEAPELASVHVGAEGSLEGLDDIEDADRKASFAAGEVVIIAQLLGLLMTFIGEALMLRLVNDAWPKSRLDDLDFAEKDAP